MGPHVGANIPGTGGEGLRDETSARPGQGRCELAPFSAPTLRIRLLDSSRIVVYDALLGLRNALGTLTSLSACRQELAVGCPLGLMHKSYINQLAPLVEACHRTQGE